MSITMDPAVHIRSTWPRVPTKALTDRAIAAYAREGRYGTEWQRRFTPPPKATRSAKHKPACTVAGCSNPAGKFLHWEYLPMPGPYCGHHLKKLRAERDKETEQDLNWKAAMAVEYV